MSEDPYEIAVSVPHDYDQRLKGRPVAVHCPNCGNPPGERCIAASGQPARVPHADRVNLELRLRSERG